MFIRTVTVKGHTYIRLVESYREGGKVKQRYIATLCSKEVADLNRDFGLAACVDVEQVADILKDHTDLGKQCHGSKRETKNVLTARAEDLINEFQTRLQAKERTKQRSADNQAQALVLAEAGQTR